MGLCCSGGRGCLRAGECPGLLGLGWNSVSGFFPGPASQILRLLWKVEGRASDRPTGATLLEAPRVAPGHSLLRPRFAFGDCPPPWCGNLGCSSLLVPSWGRCRTLVQQPEAFPRGHPQLWPHSLWLFSVPSCGRGKTQQQLCLDRFHRPERSIAGSVAFAGATLKGWSMH